MIKTNIKAIRIALIILIVLIIIIILGINFFSEHLKNQREILEFEPALAPASIIFPDAFKMKETEYGISYQLLQSGRLIINDRSNPNKQYVVTTEGNVFLMGDDGEMQEVDDDKKRYVLSLATPIIEEDESLGAIFSAVTETEKELMPKYTIAKDGTVIQMGEDGKPKYIILPDGTIMSVSDNGSYNMVDSETSEKVFSETIGSLGENAPEYMVSPDGSVIKFGDNGNPEYVIQPDGSMIKLDENGNPEYIIQPDGSVFKIDENGNLSKVAPEVAKSIFAEARNVYEDAKNTLGDNFPIMEIKEKEEITPRSEIIQNSSTPFGNLQENLQTTTGGIRANIGGIGNTPAQVNSSSNPSYGFDSYNPSASTTALAESVMAAQRTQSRYEEQNAQSAKRSFMEDFQDIGGYEYLTNRDLAAGTVINMTLITGLNSDLPGQIIAQVNQNVYDTLTGKVLLIPKGTRLIATYDSSVSWGQKRALVAWTQLVRPDGFVLHLPGLPGIDAQGYSGYQDKVNNHVWSMIGAALLASIIDLGAEDVIIQAEDAGIESSGLNAVTSFTTTIQTAGQQWLTKVIERQPTLTIRPGRRVSLLVTQTLNLTPYRGY